jgi:formylglycine-generating enzyme required for sulfatase activity
MMMRVLILTVAMIWGGGFAQAEMQRVGAFEIDVTEVTVGQFRAFAKVTGFKTKAEKEGGGAIYENGWVKKAGWVWSHPFGQEGQPDEPAVHVTFDEAQAYCKWAGKRLPTDAEWMMAAYTETRANPPAPFKTGETYPYPTGSSPQGANCLGECGSTKAIDYSSLLMRGKGPARAGTTQRGVNGLYDMGANAWEWVDGFSGRERITRGGSWWYGAAQMHRTHLASKPADTAVGYIGFRCAR